MNMGSKWGKKSLSKRKQNKTKKQNLGDTSVMLGRFPCHLRAVQACVSKSFQMGCLGRSPESPAEGSCEVYAEGRKANCHIKGQSTSARRTEDPSGDWSKSWGRIFLWGPRSGSAQCLQDGKAQARKCGQGGAGDLASGSDVWRLRLEFVGVVMFCLVKLDCHTGSASSWISDPLTTGVRTPLTSHLSLCWKATPGCPAPQAGRVT